ncbi:putative homogentisate phytyltransferase [Helianthus annuus]|nr:putative homogentisate phytyltransferase [Helianthus annuus]
MQIYVCGFNQICDIEIDKINKPYLPLASGELTMNTAIIVTALSAIMSLSIAMISGSRPLFCGLFAWFLVGTAYSANVLPLLRWKRFPYTAVLYMINSRALAMPFGYYIHVQNAIRGGVVLSRRHFFSVAMLLVFSVVLILFKDIPDIKGDEMHGIKSLASQIGPERMFWSCIWLLGMAYGVSIFVGATSSSTWSRYATILGHLATVLALWTRVKSVDLKNMASTSSMYLFLWKLFYVEYLLLPLVR